MRFENLTGVRLRIVVLRFVTLCILVGHAEDECSSKIFITTPLKTDASAYSEILAIMPRRE
jgi:hypothetical protein